MRDRPGRAVMRKLENELRPLLFEWDPIGFAEDLPADEYDCLIAPLLTQLRGEPTESELATWLGRYAERHFGLDARPEVDRVAARAMLAWWRDAGGELPRGTLPTGGGARPSERRVARTAVAALFGRSPESSSDPPREVGGAMGSAEERARRKALRQLYRADQREAAWNRLRLTREQLDDLLEYLDHRLVEPCDETLAMTRRWAEERGVPWTGFHDSGAGCDCEVLANIDPDERF